MSATLSVVGYGYLGDPRSVPAPGAPKLDLGLLERTLRRGLSDVTRLFMHAAKLALSDAGSAPDQVRIIFASAFGEIATAEALLSEAYDANGSSPARFRNSVHNTAAGLLSISAKNHLPCTAIAAGWDTVAMAFVEASAQLSCAPEPVLLVFVEECVPRAFSVEHQYGPLAVAFVLARAGVGERGTLTGLRRANLPGALEGVRADRLAFEHPLAAALTIAQLLDCGSSQTLALDGGSRPWYVDACGFPRERAST